MEGVLKLVMIIIIGCHVKFGFGREVDSCQLQPSGNQSIISVPAVTSFLIENEDNWHIDLHLLAKQDDLLGCLHVNTVNEFVVIEEGNCGKKVQRKTTFPREAIDSLRNLDILTVSTKNVLQIQILNADDFAFKLDVTRNEDANLYLRVNASVPYVYNCKGSCPLRLCKSSSLHQMETVLQTSSRNVYPLSDENFLFLQIRLSECFYQNGVSSSDIISLYPLAVKDKWNKINWTVTTNNLQLFIGNEVVWKFMKDHTCRKSHGIDVSTAGSAIWTFDCEPEEIQKMTYVHSSSEYCAVTSPTPSTNGENTAQETQLAILAVILTAMFLVFMGVIADLVLIIRLVKLERKK